MTTPDTDTPSPATDAREFPPPATLAPATLAFDDAKFASELFGPQNSHIGILEQVSGLRIATRGSSVTIQGDSGKSALAQNLLAQLYSLVKSGVRLHPRDVGHAFDNLLREPGTDLKSLFKDPVFVASPRRTVVAKTLSQREYVASLRGADMTFAVGPAGTGKTYLAVGVALSMLHSRKVKRLVLTRPAVEAGERLGFLPGDLAEKVNPYLRPLYDALHDMLDAERVAQMLASGVIEIAPLAFMRGRTLNDAFIILDEAQNTTVEQMKMFVTRLGFGSRAAITGDVTQIDLPGHGDHGTRRNPESRESREGRSGLIHALEVLKHTEGVSIVHFRKEDVVRHPLVGRIVQAYDDYQKHTG